ncbi:MAG TPA: inositol monophosphatase family protein [Candidatus Omnitrophota bacterium]|jgi:myo-inositol-1(or 4)-monophosphatase|nr:MAG: Inositol-1-monophosphatase [Candidatus Omnitrophica bacterium ADurb.Bin314]HOE69072.1 inositol monophosphatase family protein [Candidatus Omnitrophota bacterium]HQB94125.1 inositol monophosphatase family protein [Candidatus Omnitrophota bacterium]
MNSTKIKSTLLEAIGKAGKVVRAAFGKEQRITKKGTFNLVTEVDKASEKAALSVILKRFPEHSILAEESPEVKGSGGCWIIDPIDGTTNFAHGFPLVSISIAFERNGLLEMGAVLDPTRNELFFAERGKGALLNGRRIGVSRVKKLVDALVVTGFPYDRKKNPGDYLAMLGAFLTKVQCIRRTGSAALDLCYVAAGRFDGYYEMKLNPWDKAAGMLIAEEAGGRLTDFSGDPLTLTSAQNLVTNGFVHGQMLSTLSPFRNLK